MMHGYGWGMGFMGWLGGLLLFALFVAFLVAVVVLIVRAATGRNHGMHIGATPASDTAMETLRHRLAAGEITPEEYDLIKAKLVP